MLSKIFRTTKKLYFLGSLIIFTVKYLFSLEIFIDIKNGKRNKFWKFGPGRKGLFWSNDEREYGFPQ